VRSAAYWKFKEALDPSQPGGSPIMLPDDRELLAELTAVDFEITTRGIKAEPKEKVMDKLGRSPDCFVAGTLILTPRGQKPIEDLQDGDEVITPMGVSKIIKIHKTQTDELTTARFSNGSILEGKGKHEIFTWDSGWKRLDSLVLANRIETSATTRRLKWKFLSLLLTRDESIGFKHQVDIISTGAEGLRARDFYIGKFGWTSMVKRFLRGGQYITKTIIGKTTSRQTWRLSLQKSICANICWKIWLVLNSGLKHLNPWRRQKYLQKNGMAVKRGERGIVGMVRTLGKTGNQLKRIARYVRKNIRPSFQREALSVPILANRNTLTGSTNPFLNAAIA
jgi:hypothetical protein